MRDLIAGRPWALAVAARAPLLLLSAAALVSLGPVWHTLTQDFALSVPAAGLIATAQTVPLVAAVRWPFAAWTFSALALVTASIVAGPVGDDGVWPDPNIYVHLAVMFIAGTRIRLAGLVAMWLALVGSSTLIVVFGPETIGTPGLAETIGWSTVTAVAAAAVHARDEAVRELAEQQRIAEEERVRAALLGERGRIARELHDVVAHHMSVIAVQAEAAPLRVSDPPAVLRDACAAIRGSAVAGLAELRRVVGVLRDGTEPVEPQPQLDHLDALIGTVRDAGMQIVTAVEGTPRPLPPGVQLSAFRIVQEALNNVMRHAPGAAAHVTVTYTSDALEVAITNDAGRASPASDHQGHGLLGMRERVMMLGGRFDAGPAAGGGYCVTAVLPANGAQT